MSTQVTNDQTFDEDISTNDVPVVVIPVKFALLPTKLVSVAIPGPVIFVSLLNDIIFFFYYLSYDSSYN